MIFTLLIVFAVCLLIAVFNTAGYTVFTGLKARKGVNHARRGCTPSVTLLICAHNEASVISKKIDNVAKTDYPEDKLKVLFVNDHSADRTREILDAETHKIPFSVTVLNNAHERGKPNALNFAFSKIDTELIVETDADSLLEKDAVRLLVENFADPSVGGANGEVRILSSGRDNRMETDERFYRKFYNTWRKGESNIHSISVCNGPIAAFRTRLVKNLRLNTLADDTELLFDIIVQGYRFVYDERAVAYEFTPSVLRDRFRQKIRRCKGIMQVYARHWRLLFSRKYDWKIFLPVCIQFFVVPYCVMAGSVAYIGLIVNSVYWAIPMFFLLWPKFFCFLTNVWTTHLIMAAAPFYIRRKWDVVGSSRKMMRDMDAGHPGTK